METFYLLKPKISTTMIGVILALSAAIMYTVSTVLSRQRLSKTNPFSISLMTVIVGNMVIWPFTLLFTNFTTIKFDAIIFFAVAGILAPGVGRIFYYKGMEAVGASVNSAIFATNPMFVSLFAVLLLNEVLTLGNWTGIMLIVTGVILIERSKRIDDSKGILKNGLVFSFIATPVTALSQITRKQGLNVFNEPLLGLAISNSFSLLFYFIRIVFVQDYPSLRRDFRLLWKPSLCLSLALILAFFALSYEKVSVVTPLIQTQPLILLFLGRKYLKEMEVIPFKLVIFATIIVAGVALVSAG